MAQSIDGKRVRELREKKELSQEAVAKKAKIHPITLSEIERGISRSTRKTTGKIAQALGCRPAEITQSSGSSVVMSSDPHTGGALGTKNECEACVKRVKAGADEIAGKGASNLYEAAGYTIGPVPIIGEIDADIFDFSFDAPAEGYLATMFERPKSQRYVAMRVSGDCMAPYVRDGEHVIVAPADTLKDGKAGVFRLEGGCILKRLMRFKNYVELRSNNPKCKPIRLAANELEIIGRIVGIWRGP